MPRDDSLSDSKCWNGGQKLVCENATVGKNGLSSVAHTTLTRGAHSENEGELLFWQYCSEHQCYKKYVYSPILTNTIVSNVENRGIKNDSITGSGTFRRWTFGRQKN